VRVEIGYCSLRHVFSQSMRVISSGSPR
jgi:hypothetical protein